MIINTLSRLAAATQKTGSLFLWVLSAILLGGVTLSQPVLAQCQTPVFQAPVRIPVGIAPEQAITVDVNRDGRLDLIVTNLNGNSLSVLLNNGNGTSFTQVVVPLGNPIDVAVGDFNNDGIPDLAVARFVAVQLLSVLLGNGDGTFTLAGDYSTGGLPFAVAVGDFNRDGRQDISVANSGTQNISVLLGNGNGTFGAATNFPAGVIPIDLAVGDFNQDGIADLVAPNQGIGTVTVLLGSGNGSFGRTTISVGISPLGVTVGDYNRDGKADLAVADNAPNGGVFVLLGNGNGQFGTPVKVITLANPEGLQSADFNGDGVLDLAVARLGILQGNGDGSFGTFTNLTGGLIGRGGVAAGDLNGDGRPDVVGVDNVQNSVLVLTNACTQMCPANFAPPVGVSVGAFPFSVINADVNTDGKADLITVGTGQNAVSVALGTGTGTFGTAVNFPTPLSPYEVVTGDFNRDGRIDLATANYNAASVSVLLGNGNGTFAGEVSFGTGGVNPTGITTADFNLDGMADLAATNYSSGTIAVFLGNGAGGFLPAISFSVGQFPFKITTGDYDRDGRPDLAVINSLDAGLVTVLRGTGTGAFVLLTTAAVGHVPTGITTGDFNNDGRPDVAASNHSSDTVSVLLNNGNGTFAAAQSYPTGISPTTLVAGDVNRDGHLDVLVGNTQTNNVTLLLGLGNGTFSSQNYPAGAFVQSVTMGDFNRDGKLDLAAANLTTASVSVLLNTCQGCPALTLSGLPAASAGVPYQQSIQASGGSAPYRYQLVSGTLPTGLTLAADGTLSGTPTNAGTATFGILGADANGCSGIRTYQLSIRFRPTITAATEVQVERGSQVTAVIATVNDTETPAGNLVVTATTVPTGITISGITNTDGVVRAVVSAGCAALLGMNQVGLTVTDGDGATGSTNNLVVSVAANTAPLIGSYPTGSITVVAGNTVTVTPTTPPSDSGPVTVTVTAGSSYGGTLTVNPLTGVVTAAPIQTGTFVVTVTVTDSCGLTATGSFTLQVIPLGKAPVITELSPNIGPIGTSVTLTGVNLNTVKVIQFNGIPAAFTINSPTQITTTVPAGATTGPVSASGPSGSTTGPVFTVIRTK